MFISILCLGLLSILFIAKHVVKTCYFFFFNAAATTEIYTYCHTLSLHDALPICDPGPRLRDSGQAVDRRPGRSREGAGVPAGAGQCVERARPPAQIGRAHV